MEEGWGEGEEGRRGGGGGKGGGVSKYEMRQWGRGPNTIFHIHQRVQISFEHFHHSLTFSGGDLFLIAFSPDGCCKDRFN